jgi:uncharacterized protein YpmS
MLDKKKKKQKDNKGKTYIVVCCLILAALVVMVLGVSYLMLNPRAKNSTIGIHMDKSGNFQFSASTVQENKANELIEESIGSKRTLNPSN